MFSIEAFLVFFVLFAIVVCLIGFHSHPARIRTGRRLHLGPL